MADVTLPAYRRVVRNWVPPKMRRLANRMLGRLIRYRGPYATWESALAATNSYQQAEIFERVRDATNCVLRGQAGYEQDGLAMHGVPPPSHALESLLMLAALEGGKLSVIDLGGGLGSHFLRWRTWLSKLANAQWCVVEQSHFVEAGATLFAGVSGIRFVTSLEDARGKPGAVPANAVIASSVLHYLREPMAALDAIISLSPRLIVIDRTPLSKAGTPHILTQHVPRSLGLASYPLWILPRDALHTRLRERYILLSEFPSADVAVYCGSVRAQHMGSSWLRRE